MRRFLWPGVVGAAVWLTGSMYFAYRMGRRNRLSGPGQDSFTPFIDAWTQTIQVWIVPAFFAFVTVFVVERWLEDRRARASGASSDVTR